VNVGGVLLGLALGGVAVWWWFSSRIPKVIN